MAITNAQQARQLYIKGGQVFPDGRRGFGGGADMGTVSGGTGFSANTGLTGGYQGGPKGGYGGGGGDNNNNNTVTGDDYRRSKKEFEDKLKADNARREKEKKDRIAKEAREEERKLSNLGKSKTTKFGTVKTSGLTPKERYLSELAGIDPEDDEVDRTGISQLQEFTDNQRKNRYTDEIEDLFSEDKADLQDFKLSETEQKFKDFIDNRNTVPTFGDRDHALLLHLSLLVI